MCFSAHVSFGTSIFLLIVGILCLRNARSTRDYIIALLPFFLGLQQAAQGFIWFSLVITQLAWLYPFSLYLFLFFALMFWPIWIPVSFAYTEIDKKREQLLWFLSIIGGIVALYSFARFMCSGAQAKIDECHIEYLTGIPERHYYPVTIAYLLAVVAPFFITSMRYMWLIGAGLIATFGISYLFYYYNLISIWCLFAAFVIGVGCCMLFFKKRKFV
jgi:hypothetical protein